MADVSSATSATGISAPSLGGITTALQFSLTNLTSTLSAKFDQYFPPEKRTAWKEWLTKFATEKPYLASFLLSQIALSGPPLALFFIMTITVVIFALIAGILVGVLGALLFIVFAIGVALFFLLPVLFFTTAAAVFVWLWGIGTYYIVKWFNQKEIPGIHTDVPGGLAKASGLSDLPGINGEPLMDNPGDADDKSSENQHRAEGSSDDRDSGKSTGAQHQANRKENSPAAHPRKLAGKGAGSVKDGVGGVAGGATGAVGGVGKKLPL